MYAVDTNVVVRYVTNDDAQQSAVARHFIDGNNVRVCWTVILETEWVLRSAHKLTRNRILSVMRQFAGLPTVFIYDAASFATVLGWFEQGMDFADALHLAGCDESEALATFDRKLATVARKARAARVKSL